MAEAAPAESASASSDDLELANAIAAGDRKAFRTLMHRHNRLLYRSARSIVKEDIEAESVLQNAYLIAHREIHMFRGKGRLSTWLTRIVIAEALRCQRKRARLPHVIDPDDTVPHDGSASETGKHSASSNAILDPPLQPS